MIETTQITAQEQRLGTHILLNFYGCDEEQLDAIAELKSILYKAARHARMDVLKESFHQFSPYGVTGILLISESHISIHTWPEFGSAAVDIFCGSYEKAERAMEMLIQLIPAKQVHRKMIER